MQTLRASWGPPSIHVDQRGRGHRQLQRPRSLCASFQRADGTDPSMSGAAFKPAGSMHKRLGHEPPKYDSGYQQQQGPQPLTGQHQQTAQQSQFGPQPLPGAHPALKYAQMGHSSYGRGAPHICYMHSGSHGIFYSKAHHEQHQAQQQQQQTTWGQLAAHITHTATGFMQGTSSSRDGSLLAAAAAGTGGAAAALPPDGFNAAQGQPSGSATTGSSSSSNSNGFEVRPHWHVLVIQALMLAAALLVGSLVLKHFFRSVVSALVACYSGLPFKA